MFKTKWFARYAHRERIADARLSETVAGAERGIVDADLGGGLIKQRVARKGQGRSGGYRVILGYRAGDRAVFPFGFAKSQLDNIEPNPLQDFRIMGADFLTGDSDWIEDALEDERLEEIDYDENDNR